LPSENDRLDCLKGSANQDYEPNANVLKVHEDTAYKCGREVYDKLVAVSGLSPSSMRSFGQLW